MKEIRTCIACRKKKNKYDLLRIVAEGGKAVFDKDFNITTRGMYICNDKACLEKVYNSKNIKKIVKINITEEELRKVIEKLGEI